MMKNENEDKRIWEKEILTALFFHILINFYSWNSFLMLELQKFIYFTTYNFSIGIFLKSYGYLSF